MAEAFGGLNWPRIHMIDNVRSVYDILQKASNQITAGGRMNSVVATALIVSQACGLPDVIDVTEADRFGERVVVVSIPTSAEHDAVTEALGTIETAATLHIHPVFGLGSFTGDSEETRRVLSLAHERPYNEYGTPEYEQMQGWLKDVETRELDVWRSMSLAEKQRAIAAEVLDRRKSGRSGFGNCWTEKPVEAPEELAARYAAAWSNGDPVAFAAFYAEDASFRINDGEPSVGREAITAIAGSFMAAFPDMLIRVVDVRQTDEHVEFHWHWTGTNTGPDPRRAGTA